MTLKFNRLLEVVKVHVRTKFHQAKCSGSQAIMLTEKKLSDDGKNKTAVTSAGSKILAKTDRLQTTEQTYTWTDVTT